MAHRKLFDFVAEFARLGEQLGANEAAVGAQIDAIDHFAPDEFERGVYVAHVNAKNQAHNPIIKPRAENAVPRVGALLFKAADDGDVVLEQRQEQLQLLRIVLHIAVGVENQIVLRRIKSGFERGAVADVIDVMLHHDVFILRRAFVGHLAGVVEAAVIDDDDFPLLRDLAQHRACGQSQFLHGACILKRRKEKRYARLTFGKRGRGFAVAACLCLALCRRAHLRT